MSASGQEHPRARKPRHWGWLLLLLLILFGAAYYLSSKGGFDWRAQYAQLKNWLLQQTQPPKPPEKAAIAPSFDVVRAEPTGEMVMAGRSEPNWTVRIENGGQVIGEVKADEYGEWVYQPDKPLPPGDHSLSLRATSEDGAKSAQGSQRIALSITGKPKDLPIIALTEKGKPTRLLEQSAPQAQPQTMTKAETVATAEAPAAAEKKPASAPSKAEAAAPSSRLAATEQGKAAAETKPPTGRAEAGQPQTAQPAEAVQQPVKPTQGKAGAAVSFSTVDFEKKDGSGMIFMTGQTAPNARVMLYINNVFIGMAVASANGSWTFSGARDLPPGSHQLRADQVEEGTGKVVARAEVSFEQAKPEDVAKPEAAPPEAKARAMAPPPIFTPQSLSAAGPSVGEGAPAAATETLRAKEAALEGGERGRAASTLQRKRKRLARSGCRVVSVRRGDTLWNIAERCYGEGERFTKIFRSNKDQIRNPDLIYPDQRFVVPR